MILLSIFYEACQHRPSSIQGYLKLKVLRDYKSYYFRQGGFVIQICKHSDLLVSTNIVGFDSCCSWTMKQSNQFWAFFGSFVIVKTFKKADTKIVQEENCLKLRFRNWNREKTMAKEIDAKKCPTNQWKITSNWCEIGNYERIYAPAALWVSWFHEKTVNC